MPTLDISELNVVMTLLGTFTILFGFVAIVIKNVLYLGEALPALLIGIIVRPIAMKFLDADKWNPLNNDLEKCQITLGVTRVVIGIQLVMAGYQLPAGYLKTRFREMLICLFPVMFITWLATSACIMATIPNTNLLITLVLAACVTPTDPVLSQAVAKGPFADKYVARPLREIISAEAGANDGFASPFLMLAGFLILGFDTDEPQINVGMALKDWVIETLLYVVLMATAYGALAGFVTGRILHLSLVRRWVDTESYLLVPSALGLFICGTCGFIGTSDLLACFVAGCALNWNGEFLTETQRRHDGFNSSVDVLLNFGGFMYVGFSIPWDSFQQPYTTGITWSRLLALGFLVLIFRRIPAVLTCYKMASGVVKNWKDAIFMGYFGPIGVGAIYYLEHTRILFITQGVDKSREQLALLGAIGPVVHFLVVTSIVVHGLSIPALSLIYGWYNVEPVVEDSTEIRRMSSFEPTPTNAVSGDRDTFIAFNRFSRPSFSSGVLPVIREQFCDEQKEESGGSSKVADDKDDNCRRWLRRSTVHFGDLNGFGGRRREFDGESGHR